MDTSTSRPSRPTATLVARDGGLPLDRDEYAAALAEQAEPTRAAEGDRVEVVALDGRTVEGRRVLADELEGRYAVVGDDGRTIDVADPGRVEVLERTERHRLPVLTAAEAQTVAALLDELAGVYRGEPLGQLAHQMALRLYDRLGI